MRQGQTPSNAAWKGNPLGGVVAPRAIVLPDPRTRFARTAARLEALSRGHTLETWLNFMARLARAQHAAASARFGGFGEIGLARSIESGMPPLAADGHRRDPAWRDGLGLLLADCRAGTMPPQAGAVVSALRTREPLEVEALADAFLRGAVDRAEAGAALYVTAALQVYFTHAAAALPVADLRLLPQRGLCPCCGSTPVSGLITASGGTPGARYLHCSLCGTAWNHVRAACITCGETRALSLRAIDGESGLVKAETCDGCGTYAKMIYQSADTEADPNADDLATLDLDFMVAEAGWSRHAPNPFVLTPAG